MQRMSVVISNDAFDAILTPFDFIHLGTAIYDEINVLFVGFAARLMTKEGIKTAEDYLIHKNMLDELKEGLKRIGLPDNLYSIIKELKRTEGMNFYICSNAAAKFSITAEMLLPEIDGIVGAAWFLIEKANKSEIFLQF